MSQVYAPVPKPRERDAKPVFSWWADVVVLAGLVTVAYVIVLAASRWVAPLTPVTSITLSPQALPLYAGLSTMRMAGAYLLALVFSLVYARTAAGSRRAERAMIPALDILQSIPILSFLPGVVLSLVALFPRSNFGLELAAVLLIFTSQAWNMAFGFYHALLAIPKELREAAAIFHLNPWRRFTRLELPFGMIPLIWNSMMSWAGGWFFLMAAEQFTLGTHSFALPGLGSYLQTAANQGNIGALLLGLATLIIVIVLMDQLLWRPLIAWADRFKIEQTGSGTSPSSFMLRILRRSALVHAIMRHFVIPATEGIDRIVNQMFFATPQAPPRMALGSTRPELPIRATSAKEGEITRFSLRRAAGLLIGLLLGAVCLWGVIAAVRLMAHLTPDEWRLIPVSALATLLRVTATLVIGVLWTVPVGVAIGLRPRLAQRAQPVVQIVASIPATALFPVLLLLLLNAPGGLNLAAILLMLLGTQWYLLFNILAGAMAIPHDLREAASVYHLRGWRRWRILLLPAIFPYLLTGLITASGGAWNASVVAEYVTFESHTFSIVGLGALIASSANAGNYALLLASTLTMSALVVVLNRLVWRRLDTLAQQRFHLD